MRVGLIISAGAMIMMAPVFAKEAPHADIRADIRAAVASAGRPAEQVKLDESRKPAAILAFEGLKPGMKAADIMAGAGYYTEIMARVVGAKGHVTAYEPAQFLPSDDKDKAAWATLVARNANVNQTAYPFEAFAAPANSLDFTMLHLSYHDLYWQSDKFKVPKIEPDTFLAVLFKAMKPGGVVAVIDHVGAPGDVRATVDALHRIDPAVVKADFQKAGFVLEDESDLLKIASDDHSKLVFDPAVRGKTDRFAFRFRKPAKR